jgi:hypothetical protein
MMARTDVAWPAQMAVARAPDAAQPAAPIMPVQLAAKAAKRRTLARHAKSSVPYRV